ncbi:MAG: peptidase E-like protein [Anaerocolumna sp.]|jgi:dipeptidase E|nr:peptidase E-like protein [Anaerocolumna sp.]
MGINILTSGFTQGFPYEFGKELQTYVLKKESFVFLASEFNAFHDKTDNYCKQIIKMFADYDIHFDNTQVIDSRVEAETARHLIQAADVLWLSGGDTIAQYNYIKSYGLIPFIKKRDGITIGMSAGSINMTETAICSITCEHDKLEIYEALGMVKINIEPHFDDSNITDEILGLSKEYTIYGMCDDSVIIFDENKVSYLGDVYKIVNENVEHMT